MKMSEAPIFFMKKKGADREKRGEEIGFVCLVTLVYLLRKPLRERKERSSCQMEK
jgi:hypothetical protein